MKFHKKITIKKGHFKEIKNCNIKLLKPYEKNAKKHSETQIKNVAESIIEFGWQQHTWM